MESSKMKQVKDNILNITFNTAKPIRTFLGNSQKFKNCKGNSLVFIVESLSMGRENPPNIVSLLIENVRKAF